MTAAESDLEVLHSYRRLREARPTRAELESSALAWLTMAQAQIGEVRYFGKCDDRAAEFEAALDTLRSQLGHVRSAITEAEHAKP